MEPGSGATQGVGVTVQGVAAPGLGKAADFTQLSWVVQQFAGKLGLCAWPGTFNVRVADAVNQSVWDDLQKLPGIEIEPPGARACVARCYGVLVNEQVRGAIILPHVAGYPLDQIEILAAENIRARLALADGDPVTLQVFPGPTDAA